MKKILRKSYSLTLLLCVALLPALNAGAVKAKPGVIEIEQPDGSVISVRMHGDEKNHYITTEDGFLVLRNAHGNFEYAVPDASGCPVLSGVKANSVSSRDASEVQLLSKIDSESLILNKVSSTAGKSKYGRKNTRANIFDGGATRYTYSSSAFPVFGEPHSIVVLVEYPDYGFSMSDPNDYYTRFLNERGFSEYGGTGSCAEYFSDNSMGQFKPTFDLYGPVMMKNKRSYYGSGDDEPNASKMVKEVVEALDDYVDFSQYDHNKDGYVDTIYIIYASFGEADGGPEESVWPHSWELEEDGINLRADGVKFNIYGCSNELNYSRLAVNQKPAGIGTFVHEFSHVMGLPDLYNTVNVSDMGTPLSWSVLDEGPYNNGGCTPPNYSAFERHSLGWMNCREIYRSGNYELENIVESNKAIILTTEENKDEFYLLENRRREGNDLYLPGQGMLIWHVDFVQRYWDENTVNNRKSHRCVDLIRADNNASSNTLAQDAFPGPLNVTSFGYTTTPALKSWADSRLNVISIEDIASSDGKITFSAKVTEERYDAVESIRDDNVSNITVANGIISCEAGSYPVYDISGKTVGVVSPSAALRVQPGLYIVGTNKIYVK